MKNKIILKIIFILSISLTFQKHIEAQTHIGIKLGYSNSDFTGLINESFNFLSFGIPIEFNFSEEFSVRVTPSYYRYSTRFKKEKNPVRRDTYGNFFIPNIKTPILLVLTPFKKNGNISSINLGIGHSFLLRGKNKIKTLIIDPISGEEKIFPYDGPPLILENTKWKKHGIDLVFGYDFRAINKEDLILSLGLIGFKGLNNMNKNIQKEFKTIVYETSIKLTKIIKK